MVDQLPNLGREEEMLKEMGVASIDALFADVPESVRMVGDLPLPDAQSEEELLSDAKRLLGANLALGDQPSFLGQDCIETLYHQVFFNSSLVENS